MWSLLGVDWVGMWTLGMSRVDTVLIGNPQITPMLEILSDYFEFELRAVFAHESDPFELDGMSNFCGSVQNLGAFSFGSH